MPGRGSVSTVEKRRQCIAIVYDDLLWNDLVAERASKQFDHLHTFHRSTSSVGLAGADGEFPVTRAATELMHDLRGKKSTTISPALWLLSFLCSS
jgi:hypothetical protein